MQSVTSGEEPRTRGHGGWDLQGLQLVLKLQALQTLRLDPGWAS